MTSFPQSPERVRTKDGEVRRYLDEVVLQYEGADCLLWPFSKNAQGCGQMRFEGRVRRVPRIVCGIVNGPAPSPAHEAAHSCGRGNEGCCTKGHLSWKTHAGNEADKVGHGTAPLGVKNGRSKLTENDIRIIVSSKGVVPRRDLSQQFGVTVTHVAYIQSGKSWRHLSSGGQ